MPVASYENEALESSICLTSHPSVKCVVVSAQTSHAVLLRDGPLSDDCVLPTGDCDGFFLVIIIRGEDVDGNAACSPW